MYMFTVGRVIEDVLSAACTQKVAWDSFTKPQRKSINQWKDYSSVRPLPCFISAVEALIEDTLKRGHLDQQG